AAGGGRAAALLPDHPLRAIGRQGRGPAPGADAEAGAGQRVRAGEGVMRFYRVLLHLYPASFRAEYGEEMAAIFRHRLRDADGPFARLALWTSAAWETIMNALAVHWDILRQDL